MTASLKSWRDEVGRAALVPLDRDQPGPSGSPERRVCLARLFSFSQIPWQFCSSEEDPGGVEVGSSLPRACFLSAKLSLRTQEVLPKTRREVDTP